MPTFQSNHFKPSSHPRQARPIRHSYAGQQTTVPCHACNRSMVPRVISYYGQPLRSICPFCGTTFLKFPSGFQRFMQHYQSRSLSFAAFKWLTLAALCFYFLGYINDWVKLPENITLFSVLGTLGFGLMALAELFVQGVEHLAARLSHESNYYWAALVLILMITANQRNDLVNYLLLFFVVVLLRWLIVGSVRALTGHKSHVS